MPTVSLTDDGAMRLYLIKGVVRFKDILSSTDALPAVSCFRQLEFGRRLIANAWLVYSSAVKPETTREEERSSLLGPQKSPVRALPR